MQQQLSAVLQQVRAPLVSFVFCLISGRQLWDRKTENETGFRLCGVETTQGPGFSCYVPQPAGTAKKTCFFRTQRLTDATNPRHGTNHNQTWRAYAPLNVEFSLPSLRAVGGLCLDLSLGTWGPDPVLYQPFAIQNRRSFPIRKKLCTNGSGSHAQSERPRDTDHLLRPSNLAARTLSLVEHTLSKFGGDPYPVRRGLVAAVKCYVRKKYVFSHVGSNQK